MKSYNNVLTLKSFNRVFGFACIYCAHPFSPVAIRDMTKPWNFRAVERTCLPSAPKHIPGNAEVKNTVLCGL